MGFTLDKVVPWGRSYDEYVAMFDLTEADLGEVRMPAMEAFLADFETGKQENRYIAGELPC